MWLGALTAWAQRRNYQGRALTLTTATAPKKGKRARFLHSFAVSRQHLLEASCWNEVDPRSMHACMLPACHSWKSQNLHGARALSSLTLTRSSLIITSFQVTAICACMLA